MTHLVQLVDRTQTAHPTHVRIDGADLTTSHVQSGGRKDTQDMKWKEIRFGQRMSSTYDACMQSIPYRDDRARPQSQFLCCPIAQRAHHLLSIHTVAQPATLLSMVFVLEAPIHETLHGESSVGSTHAWWQDGRANHVLREVLQAYGLKEGAVPATHHKKEGHQDCLARGH